MVSLPYHLINKAGEVKSSSEPKLRFMNKNVRKMGSLGQISFLESQLLDPYKHLGSMCYTLYYQRVSHTHETVCNSVHHVSPPEKKVPLTAWSVVRFSSSLPPLS